MKDFYDILGVNINCSADEVKEAYRKLSKKFHPDMNEGDEYFETQFRRITEAYETLGDPEMRKKYDASFKEAKTNPIDEEFERRKRWKEQASVRQKYTARSASTRYKKGPGVGLSIALLIIGLISVVYLVQSFTGSKPKMIKPVFVAHVTELPIPQHHKRRHVANIGGIKQIADVTHDSVEARPVKESPESPVAIKTDYPLPVAINKTSAPPTYFLYATYVRSNITGVVNMRESGQYNSAITNVIPSDSKVYVIGRAGAYYNVSYNGTFGYVPKWALEKK